MKGLRFNRLKGHGGMMIQERIELSKINMGVIQEKAKIIIKISSDSSSFEAIEQLEGRLNVIAIIGPTQRYGRNFKQRLLMEIGMGRCIPYHPSQGKRTKEEIKQRYKYEYKFIPKRQKIFFLSKRQYLLVAPYIFELLDVIAETRVGKWKSGSAFWISVPDFHWDKKKRYNTIVTERKYPIPTGIRFSISKKDQLILQDIYWARLNLNNFLIEKLNRISRYVRFRLFHKLKDERKIVQELDDVYDLISALPRYLREELAVYCFSGVDRRFVEELRKEFAFCLPEEAKSIEQCLAFEAEKLNDPIKRLDNIQLEISSGFENMKKDHVVIQVNPSIEQEDHQPKDEIPF